MARFKDYKAKAASIAPQPSAGDEPCAALIELPPNPRNHNVIDLRPWLGLGFDDWVMASSNVLRARLQSGRYSVATIVSFASNGLRVFLPFLAESRIEPLPARPSDLRPEDVARYIAWLRRKYVNGATAKNYYSAFKSIVAGLMDYGFIDEQSGGLLPAIHHGRFGGLEAKAVVVLMLIIGMRTGINITPLLEMGRDCLQPHPFMPNLMLIRTFKRRGKGAQSTSIRQTQVHEITNTIQMDGVAVLKMALALTDDLARKAPETIKDRVWLYRSAQRGPKNGQTLCIKTGNVSESIRDIVKRHGLLADDGAPLRVSFGHLRKTMENRLWRLSDGELLTVASVMGHAPQVADNHYLRLDGRTKAEGAKFIGDALPARLRGADLLPTPVGSCKDSLHGTLAPKDGSTHCAGFTHCLGCPSYAIVGSVKDLHRLFSYQQFLLFEMGYHGSDEWVEWRSHHRRLVELIDQFTRESFSLDVVEEAKAMAQKDPHPFWATRIRQSESALRERHGG